MNTKETSMEPIPTWYKDHRYPAKQQAKQAVLMDAAGWSFEIEPGDPESLNGDEPFQVGKKLWMRPDFLLHNAWASNGGNDYCLDGGAYIEPKGKWEDKTAAQVSGFWKTRGKNILLVDGILWLPPMSDTYDDSWEDAESRALPEEMRMYKAIIAYIRSTKEQKNAKWHDCQFSLFAHQPCSMCECNCPSITVSACSSSRNCRNGGCREKPFVYSDSILCVGGRGQPVIYSFAPGSFDGSSDESTDTALLYANSNVFWHVCDIEKTYAIYKAAADADKNGLFTYDEDHPEYLARHSAIHRSPVSMHQQYALDM